MEMIQRGMDAEEIERVLAARMGRYSWHKHRRQPQQPVAHQQPGRIRWDDKAPDKPTNLRAAEQSP